MSISISILPWVVLLGAGDGATSPRCMVATVNPVATDAGVSILKLRGNAVDAAVAAALTLGVVDGHNSGIGGGCFILIRTHDGQFIAIDGRETAPAKSHRDMFVREGKVDPDSSQTGALAVAVPGALLAYERALKLGGHKPLKDLLLPAAKIAEEGFAIDRIYARNIRQSRAAIEKFPITKALLFNADGTPRQEGDLLRQSDLARSYRAIAKHGTDWFYRGPFSERTAAWMRENGGIVTVSDFADYRIVLREPLVTHYRSFKVVGFPPPSSGGVHVAQMLHTLEPFDLKRLHDTNHSQFVHVIAEAMKLAFADRAHWLGDPDFTAVPRGLASPEYGSQLSQRIDPKRTIKVPSHGTPPDADRDWFSKHTTHIAAADDDGNWVAITATVNTSFGSKVIVPETGIFLNNQMDDFSIQPGVPNAFGLVGAAANEVSPGKRPLSSMSPTIVLKDDAPILSLGAAGGPTIISQVVSVLVNRLDLQLPLAEALRSPRFHQQWMPDELVVEEAFPDSLAEKLTEMGHHLKRRGSIAVVQAIEYSAADRLFRGVHDPRVPGKAAGDPPIVIDRQLRAQRAAQWLAGDWPMERLRLKDGREFHGLMLAERSDPLEFAEILRPSGRRVSALVRPIPAADIDTHETLPDLQSQELIERFQWIRSRAKIEALRMDRLEVTVQQRDGRREWIYHGPWFELASTAGEQSTRRTAVRMEQLFLAYRQFMIPKRDSDRRLRIELYGSNDEYAAKLEELGVNFSGPAFYVSDVHTIVAGSDIAGYGQRWSESRADLDSQQRHFDQLKREFSTRLGQVAVELRQVGIDESKIREEMRLRRKLWDDEYSAATAAIREAQGRNAARFDELADQMFRRLYHESFHAYLEEYVFPSARFAFPRWLNEGLAQIFESGQLEHGIFRLDAPDPRRLTQLQRDLQSAQSLALRDLIGADERPFVVTHANPESERSYLYAWGVAYYLVFQYDLLAGDSLDRYAARETQTLDPVRRFERLVASSCDEFDAEWRTFMLRVGKGAK